MTLEEQQLEAGRIILDLKAAKRQLVCLQSAAERKAEVLEVASQALRTGSGGVPIGIAHDIDGKPEPDHERHWVTAQEANDLLDGIKTTKKKIATLQDRLKEL